MKFLYWLGFLWSLPNTLIGLILAKVFYGGRNWEWFEGTLLVTVERAIGNPGAQTWGVVICCVGPRNRQVVDSLRPLWDHEYRHVLQGLVFGPLFLLAYGFEWLFRFVFMPGQPKDAPRWFRAYWNLSWEKDARRYAGQPIEHLRGPG